MPIRKRPNPPDEQPGNLLDLPLGHATGVEPEITGQPSPPSPAERTSKRSLGDVGAIGSLESRQRRRGRFGWLWLILLLAFPLSGLVGYLLKTDPPVAALSTDLLDFGEVRLGAEGGEQILRISNQGEQVLRLDTAMLPQRGTNGTSSAGVAAGEFRIVADGCAGIEVSAQADCTLRLAFAPADRGARRAQIRLDSNAPGGPQTVPLIGVGVAPELTVEPPELDFGEHNVGAVSAQATLRLGNRGTAPLQLGRTLIRGPAAADFRTAVDGCRSRLLAPGERCSLGLAFAPTAAGDRRAELQVDSDDGTPRTASLTGHATRRAPILRLEPTELDFEPLPAGGISPNQTVTLANDGNGPLAVRSIRVEVDPEVATAGTFEVATESCTASDVPAGGACEIELRFSAAAEGEARAALAIESSATPEPRQIPLGGAGIAPHATITPERLSFGEVAVKAESSPKTVRVTSSGSDRLIVGKITVTGADAASFATRGCAGSAVAPGADCLLEVGFRPGRAGPHRADLLIEHNAGRRQALPLNGIGVAARLSLDRTAIDFGEARLGTEARQRLTLTNAGRSDLKILRMRLTGQPADFELDATDCVAGAADTALGPSASCTATIYFRPASAGSHRLQLVIDHSAATTAREVPILARATAPPEPAIRLEPARFDFPDRRVGDRSTIKTLTVSNPGTARLSLEASNLDGEHPSDFQLVPGSCASFVAPGASCTFGIRFVPTGDGLRNARLSIRHNAAGDTAALELSGRGTRPPAIQ